MSFRSLLSMTVAVSLSGVAVAQARPATGAHHAHVASHVGHHRMAVAHPRHVRVGPPAPRVAAVRRSEPLIVLRDRSGVDTRFNSRQSQFYGNENYYADERNWGF